MSILIKVRKSGDLKMVGVFAVLFLAALVGIIKPYIPSLKRWHFLLIAIAAFIGVGLVAPKVPNKTGKAEIAASSPTTNAQQPATIETATPTPSKWEYSQDTDKMRGTSARFASVTSNNSVDLEFPYGEVHGTLTVRKRPEDGLNIIFAVEKGQILCNNFTGTRVSVKFDDNSVKNYGCTTSSDGSSESAFIQGEAGFLSKLKSAKHTIIEAEFYQKARQQFEFDTAGLDWK